MQFKKIVPAITRFLRDQDGPTSVEYAVMLAFIILTCFAAIMGMAESTRDSFDAAHAVLSAGTN